MSKHKHISLGLTPVVEQIDFKYFPLPQKPVGSSVGFRTVLMSTVYTASASPLRIKHLPFEKTIACFVVEKGN